MLSKQDKHHFCSRCLPLNRKRKPSLYCYNKLIQSFLIWQARKCCWLGCSTFCLSSFNSTQGRAKPKETFSATNVRWTKPSKLGSMLTQESTNHVLQEVSQAWKLCRVSEASHADANASGRLLQAGGRMLLGLVPSQCWWLLAERRQLRQASQWRRACLWCTRSVSQAPWFCFLGCLYQALKSIYSELSSRLCLW